MRIYLKTLGCSANVAESEMMAGMLAKKHHVSNSETASDVIVINSCTVKGDQSVLKQIREIKKNNLGARIVLSGCVTPTLRKSVTSQYPDSSVITTQNITRIIDAVENKGFVDLRSSPTEKLGIVRKRAKPGIAIIPISNGCMDHCTYCSTKQSKGALHSYSAEHIVEEIRGALKEGCTQIWLTSQDVSAWGQEQHKNLCDLLNKILSIDAPFKLRIGMGNPTYYLDIVEELIPLLKDPRVYRFLHIPIQSGSNTVLHRMKRRYTIEQCKTLFERLRQDIPGITLATDIIVGFPGETESEFTSTLDTVTWFDIINISRFVPRKGTLAATMPNAVPGSTAKHRSRTLTREFRQNRQKTLAGLCGTTVEVIAEEHRDDTTLCRTENYTPIVVNRRLALGQNHLVHIETSTTFHLKGTPLKIPLPVL